MHFKLLFSAFLPLSEYFRVMRDAKFVLRLAISSIIDYCWLLTLDYVLFILPFFLYIFQQSGAVALVLFDYILFILKQAQKIKDAYLSTASENQQFITSHQAAVQRVSCTLCATVFVYPAQYLCLTYSFQDLVVEATRHVM